MEQGDTWFSESMESVLLIPYCGTLLRYLWLAHRQAGRDLRALRGATVFGLLLGSSPWTVQDGSRRIRLAGNAK